MDSEVMLQIIKANPASSTWRVPDKIGISQSSEVHHFHNLGKIIQSCQIMLYATKILLNFWPVNNDKIIYFTQTFFNIIFFLFNALNSMVNRNHINQTLYSENLHISDIVQWKF